jgi:hypothetical protein
MWLYFVSRSRIASHALSLSPPTSSTLRTTSTLSRRCLYRPATAISKQGPSLATLERITCRSSSSTPSFYSSHLPAPYYSPFSSFSSFSGAFTLSRSISCHLTLLDTSEQFFLPFSSSAASVSPASILSLRQSWLASPYCLSLPLHRLTRLLFTSSCPDFPHASGPPSAYPPS